MWLFIAQKQLSLIIGKSFVNRFPSVEKMAQSQDAGSFTALWDASFFILWAFIWCWLQETDSIYSFSKAYHQCFDPAL